jgi:hypothetical protein
MLRTPAGCLIIVGAWADHGHGMGSGSATHASAGGYGFGQLFLGQGKHEKQLFRSTASQSVTGLDASVECARRK